MARRKSVCVKWTLVLILVLFCSFVYSRPQDSAPSAPTSTTSAEADITAQNVIRYNDKYNISNKPISIASTILIDERNFTLISSSNNSYLNNQRLVNYINKNSRSSRLLGRKNNDIIYNRNTKKTSNKFKNKPNPIKTDYENKPVIKRVVTKWTDNAKFDDLKFSHELKTSLDSEFYYDEYTSTENDLTSTIKYQYSVPNKLMNTKYKPRPQYSTEAQVYSNNVQVYDEYPHSYTRPTYIFTTPTPTPIITNVGYPKPWPDKLHVSIKPTTRKPIKPTRPKYPHNHNNVHIYSPHVDPNFEVSTVKSHPAYTDRIVIRPEEYNASPYDCPTVFLSLNNTFQGEGKEACPDLNIAVNTNVINKNVVIDTEEDTDTTLTDVFGLPFGESESEEDTNTDDYNESYENQEHVDNVSIEGQSLGNYYSVNDVSDVTSDESAILGQNTALSTISRPKRPSKKKKDTFGLSSVLNFFQPVIKGFSWLAAINPLSFSAISFILTPLILLVGGFSAFATVFSPWAFSYARDASVNSNSPLHWQWDDYYKTWYWNSFPDTMKLKRESSGVKNIETSASLGHLYDLKELLQREIQKQTDINTDDYKNKSERRKKRSLFSSNSKIKKKTK